MEPRDPRDLLDLLDWKREIFRLYARVRDSPPQEGWMEWRRGRDALFAHHAQSPIPPEDRSTFTGLSYYDYDPTMRVSAALDPAEAKAYKLPSSGARPMLFERFAVARFVLMEREMTLDVYWLDEYGGGLFLPFKDETSGSETYGAGRYLLDTVKGADLGAHDGRLVLDFNFAYNPSCSYDPRWVCPLAPPANLMRVALRAGERTDDPLTE